ncbi:MAG: acyl-CoA dehydrogenase family protein, partial [Pseudomonadota bacterium]
MVLTAPPDIFGEEPQNQSPPFSGRNLYETDPLLVALSSQMPDAVRAELKTLGASLGSADSFQLADLANKNKPTLKTHDQRGRRIDRIEFHPAYHALMRRGVAAGLQGSIWDADKAADDAGIKHQSRALRFYMTAEVECGHLCPLTMTNAAPAAFRHNGQLVQDWLPRIRSRQYDPGQKPMSQKTGVTIGMAMTEKQGGTDIRTNVTEAERTNTELWLVSGHKWFMSAPMCDAFLVLAQTQNGLSCFFLPRFLPDGSRNRIRLQRLKDKLGNISNASSEVEFHRAGAFLVGAEGHGIRTILDMVTLTRLDCALASAGMMRSALAHAVNHSRARKVFDKALIDQPLATHVMADLALDCAAATVLSFRLAE